MSAARYYLGLISGTSVDAADAALVRFDHDRGARLVATHALAPDTALRDDVLALSQQVAGISLTKLGELDQRVGEWFASAARYVLNAAGVAADQVAAVGSHGQTVRHEPAAEYAFSLQLGAPSRIAARLGCPVVADFRNSDIAVGGQGAPLVPAFHRQVFADRQRNRIVINIGGIANLTVLPKAAAGDLAAVTGLDTGPGNGLMDAWIAAHSNRAFDANGRWAAGGRVDPSLLALMMADPYLSRAAPKSTGREYFNLDWLRAQIDSLGAPPTPADVQTTLCEFTARTIAQAVETYGAGDDQLLLCGGGARNAELRRRLEQRVAPRELVATDDCGIAADWVEAAAFAWLAMRRLNAASGNLPSVTGARRAIPLGAIYAPTVGA